MGSQQGGELHESKKDKKWDIKIIPSKVVFNQTEDVTGQVILELKEPVQRAGVVILSFDGKE